jgi:hypothetical protein
MSRPPWAAGGWRDFQEGDLDMPKCICVYQCQFRGVLVKPDTVLDITDEEMELHAQRIASSFRPLDEKTGAAKADPSIRDEFGMSVDDYRARLDAFKAAYGPTDTIDELRKKLQRITSTEQRKRKQ